MASPTEITAFVVALVALVIALLQVVQQYMASSILRSKVGRAAIGTWARRNRLRLNLSEFKFRQEYVQPTLSWGRVIVCLKAQKRAEINFVSAPGDRFQASTSSGVAVGARGAHYARPPRLCLIRAGDEAQHEVPRASLSWAERRAVTRHDKFLADRHNARRAICIASWSNMMAALVGNPLYLAVPEYSSDDEDDLRGSKAFSYRDADTIPSALDNPPLDIHFADLISCGVALDMEIRGYDLHKPALHMTSQYCSIMSQEHSGVGVIAQFTHNPSHVHHIQTCTPHEVDNLVKTAKGYLRIGDAGAHMTDWGYNSVNALFGIIVDSAQTDDWHQMALGERFHSHCEGDGSDLQWKGLWSRPMTTRVGFLLTHCGNPAVANSFPHSLLKEWSDYDRSHASKTACDFINEGVGFIEAPQDFPSSLHSLGVVMNEYKLANNWGAEFGGIRGWSMSSGADTDSRGSSGTTAGGRPHSYVGEEIYIQTQEVQ
ncbi:hypothetical protein K438DRAFT_229210 [Mycena galopus ATCC 62051]|nr:hypothetical protein K438DRAFT_229210 [Mycena galopus ATCC 62051]